MAPPRAAADGLFHADAVVIEAYAVMKLVGAAGAGAIRIPVSRRFVPGGVGPSAHLEAVTEAVAPVHPVLVVDEKTAVRVPIARDPTCEPIGVLRYAALVRFSRGPDASANHKERDEPKGESSGMHMYSFIILLRK